MTDRPTKLRILLVEDSLADAELACAFLRQAATAAFVVQVAETLAQALAADPAAFDAVLLDLTLPDSEGVETARRLLGRAGGTPVIVLSGIREDAVARACVDAGATDYLPKEQLSADVLWRAVRFGVGRLRSGRLGRGLNSVGPDHGDGSG